jgi:ABC-2 type transport system ATP-binding protein
MGRDVWRDRENALAKSGAIVETPAFYPYLSGRDNLTALALIRGGASRARVDLLLERVGLSARAKSKYRTYSLGMKQRLGIASTLLSDPPLVILDEPANGLDPAGQREIRELVRELAKEEHGVLLASHLLHEVEQICDRVLVINKGKLIVSGTIAEVTAGAGTIDIAVGDPARAAATLRALPGITDVQEMKSGVKVTAEPARGADVNRALAAAGIYASAIVPHKSSLEDVFLEITDEGGPSTSDAPTAP